MGLEWRLLGNFLTVKQMMTLPWQLEWQKRLLLAIRTCSSISIAVSWFGVVAKMPQIPTVFIFVVLNWDLVDFLEQMFLLPLGQFPDTWNTCLYNSHVMAVLVKAGFLCTVFHAFCGSTLAQGRWSGYWCLNLSKVMITQFPQWANGCVSPAQYDPRAS